MSYNQNDQFNYQNYQHYEINDPNKENKRTKKGIATTAVIILLIVTNIFSVAVGGAYMYFVGGTYNDPKDDPATTTQLKKLLELKEELDENYYYGTDEATQWEYIYKGLFAGLGDPYSYYLSADEYAAANSTEEEYVGIGIQMQSNDAGEVEIVKVFMNSPASKSGLKAGDIIVSVDGTVLTGMNLTEASTYIRGTKEGSKAKLVIKRDMETFEVDVVRKKITTEYVAYKMLSDDIGYIHLVQFEMGVDKQFSSAVKALKDQGAKKLILDLRDNPGGIVDVATNIADEIMGKATIISTVNKSQEIVDVYKSDAKSIDMEVVVLINGNSASASEILAGTLKNNDAATVVGTKSYGKGIIQYVLELPDGSAYQYTAMEYILPGEEKIHGVGITPDIEVLLPKDAQDTAVESLEYKDDLQLQKAIELLK